MSAWTSIRNKVTGGLEHVGHELDVHKNQVALAAALAAGGWALAPELAGLGGLAGTTAEGALGELGINTALAAGTPGGIATGTSIADLGGYTPAWLSATKGYLSDPKNLASLAKTGASLASLGKGGAGGGASGIGSLMGGGGGGGGAQAPGVQAYNPSGNYVYEDASPINMHATKNYSTPMQMPEDKGNEEENTFFAAAGGLAGLGMQGMAPNHYKAGGKYLHGPGDGMSDNIKANIDGHQEARLATSEFVLPADVVSHIGNGSSEAGAKKLYAMMDRIRMARTGTKEQGKQIKAEKYLPA